VPPVTRGNKQVKLMEIFMMKMVSNMRLCKPFASLIHFSCTKRPVLKTQGTTPFEKVPNPYIVIFIKPWDDEVLANFISMLK